MEIEKDVIDYRVNVNLKSQDQSRYEHNSTILGRNIHVFKHPPNASDVSPALSYDNRYTLILSQLISKLYNFYY